MMFIFVGSYVYIWPFSKFLGFRICLQFLLGELWLWRVVFSKFVQTNLSVPSLDLYSCSFCTIVLSCGDFMMNSESKKHEYFAKVLSNRIYAVPMGTVHGRCTTTEKSKYCFAIMGSFSSYGLTGPSGECGCLLSLPSLSWFLLVSGSGFSFSSHKMTFFFLICPGDWSCLAFSSLHLFFGALSLLSQGLQASRFFGGETEGQQLSTSAVAL